MPLYAGELSSDELAYIAATNTMVAQCHGAAVHAGWWGEAIAPKYLVPTKLALIHSEISEALEAFRTDATDAHLPPRPGIEVELADAVIRICDLAGHLRLDLGGAIIEKRRYNMERAARAATGGKKI